MRAVIEGVVLVVLFLLATVLAFAITSRLLPTFGTAPLYLVLVSLGAGTAWVTHTPESRRLADQVRWALARIGMSHKEAAIRQGLTPERWSRQLAGTEMLLASRMVSIGPAFRVALAEIQLEDEGRSVAAQVADLLAESRAVLVEIRAAVRTVAS